MNRISRAETALLRTTGNRMPLVSVLLLLFLLIGALSSPVVGQSEDSPPAEAKLRLEGLLPGGEEVGLDPEGGPEFYVTETLYEYINGASEGFIHFDFEVLVHQNYGGDETEITVDIYDMGSPLNAFGVYSSERSIDYDYIEIGTEGYLADYLLNFVQGRYYTKLSAFARDEDLAPLLRETARAISRNIPETGELPRQFSYFPERGRIPHSEAFIAKAPMGHEFLAPAFRVGYRVGEEASTVLISPAETAQEASDRASRLKDQMAKIGEVEAVGEGGTFLAKSRYEGNLLVSQVGRLVVVITDPPDSYDALRNELVKSLQEWK